MNIKNTESKDMRTTKLKEEIKQATEQVWDLMLFGASGEEIIRVQSYIIFLENEMKLLKIL